jgi:hypothetical protein
MKLVYVIKFAWAIWRAQRLRKRVRAIYAKASSPERRAEAKRLAKRAEQLTYQAMILKKKAA